MWKVSWLYEKVHDFLVVPLYYCCLYKVTCLKLSVTYNVLNLYSNIFVAELSTG